MNFNKVDANRIKFEARFAEPPDAPQRGSKFGRFLHSFGALAAPVGFASAFFFPPAALVGATWYGLGQYGGYRDATKRAQPNSQELPVYFPGVTTAAGGPAAGSSAVGDPMSVLVNRQATVNDMIGQVR